MRRAAGATADPAERRDGTQTVPVRFMATEESDRIDEHSHPDDCIGHLEHDRYEQGRGPHGEANTPGITKYMECDVCGREHYYFYELTGGPSSVK